MRMCFLIGKNGPAAYLSHLEWGKAIERALRRSRLPVMMTQGFNRHFKISFNGALAVGEESQGELVEVELEDGLSVPSVRLCLAAQLPKGMELAEAFDISRCKHKLIGNAMLNHLAITVQLDTEMNMPWLRPMAEAFAADTKLMMEIQRKSGLKLLLLSDYLSSFLLKEVQTGQLHFEMEIQISPEGSIKPAEVLQAFLRYAGIESVLSEIHVLRCTYRVKTPSGYLSLSEACASYAD